MKPELFLDSYERAGDVRWCWKLGLWSSQEFVSEEAAVSALSEQTLVFWQNESHDPYEAAVVATTVNFDLEPPLDLWLVADAFYCKPSDYHAQVGKFDQFTPPSEARILRLSRSQFEAIAIAQSIDGTP